MCAESNRTVSNLELRNVNVHSFIDFASIFFSFIKVKSLDYLAIHLGQ